MPGVVIHRERLTTPEGGHAGGLNSFLSYPQKMRVRHFEPSEPIREGRVGRGQMFSASPPETALTTRVLLPQNTKNARNQLKMAFEPLLLWNALRHST